MCVGKYIAGLWLYVMSKMDFRCDSLDHALRQEYEATFKEMSRNENAFILAWLGLGGIILAEDLVLAASGKSKKIRF